MFSGLDAASVMDESARRSFNRRLNPVVDLAAAAEDRLTSDGYGLAHNSARSELVGCLLRWCCCSAPVSGGSPCWHCRVAVLMRPWLAYLQLLHQQPKHAPGPPHILGSVTVCI
jgi:hypothetical protein